MSAVLDLPRSLTEITPAFLSGLLGARVTGLSFGTIINGTATKAIVRPVYAAGPPPGAPASICFKGGFDEPHAEALAQQGSYVQEGRYYRDIMPRLKIPGPHIHTVLIDEAAGHCVIAMEDLEAAGAVFLRVTRDEITVDEAAALLEQLAVLHGESWNQPERYGWLDKAMVPESPLGKYFQTYTPAAVADLLQRRGAGLSAAARDPGRLLDAFWQLQNHSADAPLCVLHGDAHVGNLYRRADGGIALCDWQTIMLGRWRHDVAYLLGSGLNPAIRGREERRLLNHYLGALRGHGVEPPDQEAAWHDYRRAMMYGLFGWLTNPLFFQPEEISAATTKRFATATEELGTVDLLLAEKEA